MDEAASRLRLQQESKPEIIDQLDHDILTLKIELEALKKETDRASSDRRVRVQERIDSKATESASLTRQWEDERQRVLQHNKLREQLDAARIELDRAKRAADYEKWVKGVLW